MHNKTVNMSDGFAVVVVLGLAIFGMIWITTEAGNLGTGSNPETITVYSSSPGTIGEANPDFRTEKIGSFTVGETRGNIQAYISDRETISNQLLSQDQIIINYNATQPGQGQINFEVLGREGKGKIYAEVNGEEVFKAATVSEATPEINISKENFNPGMNKIIIGTTKTGLIGKATYSIEDLEVTVNDRKFHDYQNHFEIYQHELENFRPSNLTFQIPTDSSIPDQPLEVEVNDRQVFSQATGRSIQETTLTPQNADLTTGYNTIQFQTNGQSKYTVENAEIQVRYATNTQPANQNINFQINQTTLNYIQRENTQETLNFDYTRITNTEPIQLTLNENTTQINPQSGENTININDDNLETENTLQINSNTTFNMQNLKITSKQN